MPKDRIRPPRDFDAMDTGPDVEDAKPWVDRDGGGSGGAKAPPHRDSGRKPHRRPVAPQHREASFEEGGRVWIWGLHAASAALGNPARRNREAFVTRNAARRVGLDPDQLPEAVMLVEPKDLDRKLPDGAVHQGLAVLSDPLEPVDLSDIVIRPEQPIVILDQVTDPQNVGAILRSAAAFGFGADRRMSGPFCGLPRRSDLVQLYCRRATPPPWAAFWPRRRPGPSRLWPKCGW